MSVIVSDSGKNGPCYLGFCDPNPTNRLDNYTRPGKSNVKRKLYIY